MAQPAGTVESVIVEKGETSGVKGIDEEFFGTDISSTELKTGRASFYKISIAANSAAQIQVTLDSGATWVNLATLVADTHTTFEVAIRSTDTFNMRSTVAGTTVHYCRVDGYRR